MGVIFNVLQYPQYKVLDSHLYFIQQCVCNTNSYLIISNSKYTIECSLLFEPMKKMFQKFDNNTIALSPTKSYSTTLGQFTGFLLFIFMILLILFKLKAVIHRDIIYLNSFQYFDRFPIDMSDAGITLSLGGIDYNTQFSNGLNVTIEQAIYYKPSGHYNFTKVQMTQCEEDPTSFCIPSNLKMILEGRSGYKDNVTRQYIISIDPCNQQLSEQCSNIQPYIPLIIFHFNFRNFSIFQKQTESIISDDNETNYWFIMPNKDTYTIQQFEIMGVQIDTQKSLFPSFIPLSENVHQQFWYYNQELINLKSPRTHPADSIAVWKFRRSARSLNYQRRYKTIDSMLAQIVGIVSILAFIFTLFVRPYTLWRYNQSIVSKILGNRQQKLNFYSYVRSFFTSNPTSFKQALKKAEENFDPIVNYQKMSALEEVLKTVRILEDRIIFIERSVGVQSSNNEELCLNSEILEYQSESLIQIKEQPLGSDTQKPLIDRQP